MQAQTRKKQMYLLTSLPWVSHLKMIQICIMEEVVDVFVLADLRVTGYILSKKLKELKISHGELKY